jgi:ADP-heptose:LPS heptosyltransferase
MPRPRKLRILVVARGHLGDLVGALPALRDLRAGYPDAHITLIANEYVRGALEHCPFVNEVIYGFAYARRSGWRTTTSRLELVARIAFRYDIALLLRMSPPSAAFLGLLSGARIRIGYHESGLSGRLLNRNLGPEPHLQPNRATNLAPVRTLGLHASPVLPRLDWVTAAERARADGLLAARGIAAGDRFAVFQIASHWGCYEWRSEKWAILADHLASAHDMKVVVVGTGEAFERSKFEQIAELSSAPCSIQGATTPQMLFHVVSRASMVVSADSALTQIALAQRVPSVILFGIEPRIRNGPMHDDTESLMESVQHWEGKGLAPAPNPHCMFGESHCHTDMCRENSSFQRISAEEVHERVDRLISRVEGPGLTKNSAASVL